LTVRVTLVLPPLTQLNTPYPSTAYLARCLRAQGVASSQRDLGLELVLALFSRPGLERIFDELEQAEELPEPAWRALALRSQHLACIEPVIRFLQGRDRTLAPRILDTPWLPRGPRLASADLSAFGPVDTDDAARRVATLYLEDLADLVTAGIDPGFELARYHHHLALGPTSFEPLAARLAHTTLVDEALDALADTLDGDLVGLSVPFPGNLYGALRIGRRLQARGIEVVLGGGYVNTELRGVSEPRLWDCVDALTYDAGEGPLLALLEHLDGGPDRRHRTLTQEGWHQAEVEPPPSLPVAWYGDLPLGDYLQLVDTLNPAHRLWSDGRWNKATLAHGCYWKRCTFCDIQLDYIGRYVPSPVPALVDAVEELVEETGQSGLHLVDEAAPPKLLRDLALELLARDRSLTWWGNIRFESAFTPDLCRLLAASGLVAVTGGLEVASDRLLERMDKGVRVDDVARVAASFRAAGVLVHAYLMYGYPGQTGTETVEAMERVRLMFREGLLSSAFWHRFVLTSHSGIARDPDAHGVSIEPLPDDVFAANDRHHVDRHGTDPVLFDEVLPAALEAWMQGRELDRPSHTWLAGGVSPAQVSLPPQPEPGPEGLGRRLVWIGGDPLEGPGHLVLHTSEDSLVLHGAPEELEWVAEVLDAARPGETPLLFSDVVEVFPGAWSRFQSAWSGLRRLGLLRI